LRGRRASAATHSASTSTTVAAIIRPLRFCRWCLEHRGVGWKTSSLVVAGAAVLVAMGLWSTLHGVTRTVVTYGKRTTRVVVAESDDDDDNTLQEPIDGGGSSIKVAGHPAAPPAATFEDLLDEDETENVAPLASSANGKAPADAPPKPYVRATLRYRLRPG
jgi:hypothetical protein